ncbi:hypothetical protein D0T49_09095 [Paludibacter sp. 221]|uniref:BamA/OMP85 family outer membrane protein n=1 Tax=Paludibacter sp. 221 TaxID=2302939 RepID=UPI0013D0BB47|nr:BamA/TamA family outer membrane protein [Paludibacter sp. 221]NDV47199.1 hypothetical protein [Paludibacter sp. 221]
MKIFNTHISQPDASTSKLPFICVLLLAVLVLPVRSTAQNNYEIRKIKFTGNKTIEKSELLDQLAIHESNFIQRQIQKKEASLYSHELIDADVERLTRYYQSKGFLHVDVQLDSLALNNKKQTLNIYFAITENPPVLADSVMINIDGSVENFDEDRFQKRMPRQLELTKNQRFEDDLLYTDISRLNMVFINRGYVYTNTDFRLNLRPLKNATCIYYNIQPEKICQFGETTVSGNRYVKEKYITRQLNYKEGITYSQELLDKTRKQLYDLQLFRIVSISPQMDKETERNPIPIQIRIDEMPRWMTKFGVGWGTEDKFRAFADVTYRGLFGGTSRLNLYAKHSALTPYYISLSWIEPQFFLKKLSLTVNPYIRRENEPGYDVQRIGLNITAGYRFTDKLNTSLGYYIERVRQFDATEADSDSDIFDPESRNYLYNKSGISASVTYSNAQPVMSPMRGGSVSVGGKLNGYIFGSSFNYTKLWIDARKYQRIGRLVIAGRAMIGGINSSDESQFIPVEDRFYSGGGNSNRGWARAYLGPTYVKEENGNSKTLPSGGKSILEMNLEFRHPLFWQIELAAFLDVANVWTQSYHFRPNELNYATGGGIRVNTPIGPIRFDVGVPIFNEKKSVQFFLSVGQAF